MPRTFSSWLVGVALLAGSPVIAQSTSEDERGASHWTVEGGFAWAWTFGNDVWVGSQIGTDATIDEDALRVDSERVVTPLLTNMGSSGQPILRVQYDWEHWGLAGEVWRLESEGDLSGSAFLGDDVQIDLWQIFTTPDYDILYSAKNELSSWIARGDLTRKLNPALSLDVGIVGGRLNHETFEEMTGELDDPFLSFFLGDPQRFSHESRAKMRASVLGPSLGLRYRPRVGASWALTVSVSESLLVTRARHEASFADRDEFELFFLEGSIFANDDLRTEFTRTSLVPATDLRASATYTVNDHFALGVTGFASIWFDAPRALRFSGRTGWSETTSTLSFVSFGPLVRVSF